LRDEQTNHEDEIDMLQEEIRNKENAIQQISSNYEHDVSMRDQKISQMDA
jgi:predicted  nucleic acid-binding Zn-ribbon protein